MGYVSHKMLYEAELEEIIGNYEAEYFIWGEELVDCTIVVLPNKGNTTSAKHIKSRVGACLVVVDKKKASPVRCVQVQMSPGDLKIYIRLDAFNSIWRLLYNDVRAGIAFKLEAGAEMDITCPDDILDLSQVQRDGFTLKMESRKLKYVKNEPTPEEMAAISRKQSLLDNVEMNYFYSSNATCFHDRNCTYVAKIAPLEFQASAEMPENLYMCNKCRRDMLVRRACAPRTKQIGPVKHFLHQCCLDDESLKRYVLQDNMKMSMSPENELMVHCHEDTWKVSRGETGKLTLWHNNYIRVSETERYVRRITDGFHKQACDTRSLIHILNYVENYTWEKHLLGEAEKKAEKEEAVSKALVEDVAAETPVTPTLVEEENAVINTADNNKKRNRILGWFSRLMELLGSS